MHKSSKDFFKPSNVKKFNKDSLWVDLCQFICIVKHACSIYIKHYHENEIDQHKYTFKNMSIRYLKVNWIGDIP